MDSAQKLLVLWPGLPRLWRRGDVIALGQSVAFAALFNLVVLATLLWPEWLATELAAWLGDGLAAWAAGLVKMLGWPMLAGWWMTAFWKARRSRGVAEPKRSVDETLLPRAQGEYLKQHWFEAESLLNKLLQQHPGDVEARLLLATVYRRSRRPVEALAQLAELEQSPGAARWTTEIAAERRCLSQSAAESSASAGRASQAA